MNACSKLQCLRNIVVAGIAAGFAGGCGPSSPPPTSSSPPPSAAANKATDKALTPPWPPAVDQASAVSQDLFAKNYYVVLDGSGSMKESACSGNQIKMEAAKSAVAAFAASVPADANLGLQVFDNRGVREWLPLGTGNRERFTQLVNQVRPTGNTPLRDSVDEAYAKLIAQGRKQLGYGEYHLVIVTDGEANAGQDPTPSVNALLKNSPIVLHTVGFCIGGNHSLNQAGRTLYKAADNPDALRQGLADVLAESPTFSVSKFK